MTIWGVEIKPGKPFTLLPDKSGGKLRISQATLGMGSSNNKSYVQCNVGNKSPVMLCVLLPDKSECLHLDLEFDELEEVIFSVVGPRSVYLSGYFICKTRQNLAGDSESESYGEDIGETESEDIINDDDYEEDSFIDDSDPEVFSPSPSSSEEINKKKAGTKKSTRKHLKKKFEVSDSEDDYVLSKQNTTNDPMYEEIVENGQEDRIPISSLCGSAEMSDRKSKRKRCDFSGNTTDDLQPEDKKSKKKKKKNKENEASKPFSAAKSEINILSETGENRNCNTRTISGGLIVEELVVGDENGTVASSGKKVTVTYTGKLKKGGQIFDSTAGKDPLKFRLGKGRVMDGLDLGIEGMRVGGKRRLQIPPELGFGREGSSRIPPNSWLIMDVKLLRVR